MNRLCLNINGLLISSSKQVKRLEVNTDNSLKLISKYYVGRSLKKFMRSEDYDRFRGTKVKVFTTLHGNVQFFVLSSNLAILWQRAKKDINRTHKRVLRALYGELLD